MIEQKALAYVNMYGVLGSLENLCEIDETAKEILKDIKSTVSLSKYVREYPAFKFITNVLN